jgi:Uma2 family endonuclease
MSSMVGVSSVVPRRLLTWRQFAAIDEGAQMRGVELVDGELEEGEVPTRKHGRIVTRLIMLLGPWLERSGGGELLSQDNRVRIGPRRVRKPDLVLVRRADNPVFEDETLVSPPFIIVEVITKTARDEHRDRVTKLADYESLGAQQYWIIDPDIDRLEVYTLADGLFGASRVFEANDVVVGDQLGIDGLAFRPAALGTEL